MGECNLDKLERIGLTDADNHYPKKLPIRDRQTVRSGKVEVSDERGKPEVCACSIC